MQKALHLYETTIGKKAIMAVTGIVLYGFVLAHMLGNLQVFLGPEALNGYAAMLHSMPGVLWGARLVLLVSLVAHMTAAYQVITRNISARPVAYAKQRDLATTFAAKTMALGGPIILLFIVFHLLHFTTGNIAPGYEHVPEDVYGNVIQSFSNPALVAVYAVAQVFVAMHLYHGVWSAFQTLGLFHPRYNAARKALAVAIALAVAAGNLAMPLSVLFGVIGHG